MAYTPYPCDNIWLEFKEDYTTPDACDVLFRVDNPLEEQSYTLPNCTSIWFEFKNLYNIPSGCSVTFQIGPSETISYIEISPHDVTINIDMDMVRTFSGVMMLPHDVTINPEFDTFHLDPVWEINNHDVNIVLGVDSFNLEILPDMQIKDIDIVIDMDGVSIKGTTESDLPRGAGSESKIMGWNGGSKADISHLTSWDKPTSIHINPSIRTITDKIVSFDCTCPWTSLNKTDISMIVSASDLEERLNYSGLTPWLSMTHADITIKVPGNSFEEFDITYEHHYKTGIPVDLYEVIPWGIGNERTLTFELPWNSPKAKDSSHSANWGPFSYFSLCTYDYSPAQPCNVYFEFPNKYDLNPGVCQGISFNVNSYMSQDPRCKYNHYHTGQRDNPVWVNPSNEFLTYPMDLGVYHMLNMILVEEVITGDPIEVLHVDAKIDMSSWLWSFNVTVASKCFLDKIKPVDGILGNIKITMNGWEFLCTVESWSENRAWGSEAWTITGRSPSMLFGGPIADPRTVVIETGKQGQTIFEDYMIGRTYPTGWPYTLWESNFERYLVTTENPVPTSTGFRPYENWYLPGETVSYSEKTDIEFLKELADSIGAYIQTEPALNASNKSQLTIIPRFAHQPWNWNISNTGINWRVLNESQCVETARKNDVKALYHAVNVLGESLEAEGTSGAGTSAIYTNVVRDGWDSGGAEGSSGKYAPMITNPYITTSKAALEKGRMIVGDSGEWIQHTLRVGMLCDDPESSTSLFRPGDMISVLERGTPFYGQVTGVTIAAVSAGSGFAIEQVIEVEEYMGDGS